MCNRIGYNEYRPSAYFIANDGKTDSCTVPTSLPVFLMLKVCILMILINQLELIETGCGVSVFLGWHGG